MSEVWKIGAKAHGRCLSLTRGSKALEWWRGEGSSSSRSPATNLDSCSWTAAVTHAPGWLSCSLLAPARHTPLHLTTCNTRPARAPAPAMVRTDAYILRVDTLTTCKRQLEFAPTLRQKQHYFFDCTLSSFNYIERCGPDQLCKFSLSFFR